MTKTGKTFKDVLIESIGSEDKVDELLMRSAWGSLKMSGINRPWESFNAKSPRDLPRVPKSER